MTAAQAASRSKALDLKAAIESGRVSATVIHRALPNIRLGSNLGVLHVDAATIGLHIDVLVRGRVGADIDMGGSALGAGLDVVFGAVVRQRDIDLSAVDTGLDGVR